jgi:hypothetical protein
VTKLITIAIVVVLIFVGCRIFVYYEQVANQQEEERKDAAAALVVGDQLPGIPSELEESLRAARNQGANGLTNWLKSYGTMIQDPRKAWIELDYVVMIGRDKPYEARRMFADIKERTPASSPVYPRIQRLQRSYE